MNSTLVNILVVVGMVLLLALSIAFRLWQMRRSPMGRVVSILSDLRDNEKSCAEFSPNVKMNLLKTSGWERNKEKIKYVPEDLRSKLSTIFDDIHRVNENISAAMKITQGTNLDRRDIDKLNTPLAKSREELQKWVMANMNNPAYQVRKFSIFRWK